MFRLSIAFAIIFLLIHQPANAAKTAVKKEPQPDLIIGWVEKVSLPRLDATFKAKIDTGATTTSIDAKIIDLPEEPGEDQMEEIEAERGQASKDDEASNGDAKKPGKQPAKTSPDEHGKSAKADTPPLPPKRDEDAMPPRQTVIFSILDADGNEKIIERPLVRWVKIKKKASNKGSGKKPKTVRRPVVNLKFCIAGRQVSGEVNLSDREHFTYPVLIGRNMLSAGNFLVNSSREFQGQPKCVDG